MIIPAVMHRSRYFNLDSVPREWTKEEFVFAVRTLESLDRAALLKLLDKFEIVFYCGNDSVEEEQMISVLFDDSSKAELLEALHWRGQQKHAATT